MTAPPWPINHIVDGVIPGPSHGKGIGWRRSAQPPSPLHEERIQEPEDRGSTIMRSCQAHGVHERPPHASWMVEESPTLRCLYPPLTNACSPIKDRCRRASLTMAPSLMMLSWTMECSMTAWEAIETYGPMTERRICAPSSMHTGGMITESSV